MEIRADVVPGATLFQARNTVVWLPSSLNSWNAVAMLLLVASCVDRSILAHTVVCNSALKVLTVKHFRLEFLETKITCHFRLIAHWPEFIHKVGVTPAR